MNEYIYCIDDFERSLEEATEEMFGYDLRVFIVEKAVDTLKKHANLYRFYDRNCAGCVSGPKECDVAFGRGGGEGVWDKVRKGELFDCPVRTGGTMVFSQKGGIKDIDISDRSEPKYPVVKVEE